jgi:hypothetical protein
VLPAPVTAAFCARVILSGMGRTTQIARRWMKRSERTRFSSARDDGTIDFERDLQRAERAILFRLIKQPMLHREHSGASASGGADLEIDVLNVMLDGSP